MQKIVASILFIAFLGQSFDQGWYYLGYLIEKKEYVKRCENKSRPQLRCNGKCQLMKKIKEQEEKTKGQAPELKLAAKSLLVSSHTHLAIAPFYILSLNTAFSIRTIGIPIDRPSTFFHPPGLA